MQVHQRMDLDQTESHHPIKPMIGNNNLNENNVQKKPALKRNNSRSNRAFGQDLTNQQRQIENTSNQNNLQKISKPNQKNQEFNVEKPKIVVIDDNEGEDEGETQDLNMKNNDNDLDSENEEEEEGEESSEDIDLKYIIESSLSPWDAVDKDKDIYVTDYINSIMMNLKSDENTNFNQCVVEKEYDFMASQNDVNSRMRSVLIDWLIEVHRKFKLLPATYFLGINMLDRYMAKKQLHRRKLQLAGLYSLYIYCEFA